ncbi:proline-serine-threonine phosphatase-interacting protein 1 isoform X2 [Lethenteron reissneri]|uniref:proline-serine-threonine phosphatase-interacting protein 1 isoform X2 n=1 Tax=Lethenteron reissneri TaxID=7753 RepID=UPI002AB78A7C|nr:proline-serine-threonine phosphatase-interacting protein 1 isoform X2 [Lethenteron reissneri]
MQKNKTPRGYQGSLSARVSSRAASMMPMRFKDSFWCADFTSTVGYDVLVARLTDGRKMCKDVEDLIKSRANLEDRYGKDLIHLARKAGGHTELNALRKSFDTMKQQLEWLGSAHMQLATSLRDEARRLEEFREKQREQRKKVESAMDKLHKQRATLHKKTLDAKRGYEQRCREADEAESAAHNKNAACATPRQQEKVKAKGLQTREAAHEADRQYQQLVDNLEALRRDWESEHVNACEGFEQQEFQRVNVLRNSMWIHTNQLSQQCVQDDEIYEGVRKVLEQCDLQAEIDYFVQLKQTGSDRPAPIVYENYYMKIRDNSMFALDTCSQGTPNAKRRNSPIAMNSPKEKHKSTLHKEHVVYSSITDIAGRCEPDAQVHRVLYTFAGQEPGTLSVVEGDQVLVLSGGADAGWVMAEKCGQRGHVPASYLEAI